MGLAATNKQNKFPSMSCYGAATRRRCLALQWVFSLLIIQKNPVKAYPAACILVNFRCSQNQQLTLPLGPSPQKLRPFGPAPFQGISWDLITCSAFSTQPSPPIHSASHLLEVLRYPVGFFSFHERLVLILHLRPFVF